MRIKDHEFVNGLNITISLGVNEYSLGKEYSAFLAELDDALYQSKDQGRNRTTVVD